MLRSQRIFDPWTGFT